MHTNTPSPKLFQTETRPDNASSPNEAANLMQAQTLEIASRQLKQSWEISDHLSAGMTREFDRLKEKERHLIEKEGDLAAREALLARSRAEVEEKARQAAVDTARAAEESAAASKRSEEASQKEADNAKEAERISEIQRLAQEIWPDCLSGEKWEQWKKDLYQRRTADSNTALLLAAFHRFCAAQTGNNSPEVYAALEQIGKYLYLQTESPDVTGICTSFNEAGKERFSVQEVRAGDAPQDTWMNYEPGLGRVKHVNGWAVFKGSGPTRKLVSKAEVS
jgi:hypothetical protein